MKRVYLDHAAATPIDPRARKAMLEAFSAFGNPSSYNDSGREAAELLSKARKRIARFLNARAEEILFASSGSEANAMAIQGIALKGTSILASPIEHMSVLESAKASGAKVVMLSVNEYGLIEIADLQKKLSPRVALVSVMYANNEIGTIEPIAKIGKAIREFKMKNNSEFPLFHVDACQAADYLDMDVQRLGVDLLTFNGSKVYGPRGIAVLYIRRGVELAPFIRGGGQERGIRAGTENVAGAVGLAKALDSVSPKEGKRLSRLRDYFFAKLEAVLPETRINGTLGDQRLPHNINISISGLDSENLLLELDKVGISAGSGSACTARSVEPSHVLKAIGVRSPYLDGALRFSLGRSTKKSDVDYLLKVLPSIVSRLRKRYDTNRT